MDFSVIPALSSDSTRPNGVFRRVLIIAWPGLAVLLGLALTRSIGLTPWALGSGGLLVLASLTVAFSFQRTVTAPAEPSATGETPPVPLLDPHKAALDLLPDPVLVVVARELDDLSDRRILFANQAAIDFLRLQRIGGPLVAAVRDPAVLEAVDEALFNGEPAAVPYEPVGGHDRSWLAITRPLGQTVDGTRLALAVFRDETEARRSEQARADFLANASHELRTPLASLAGFIETLRGHARDDIDARDRFLAIMHAQAERMSRLIDDLMSLSRIEQNEHIAPAGQVDLTQAALDVIDALSPLVQARGQRIDSLLAPMGDHIVEGERDQIIQVVQNLIENAIKYTPPGGVILVESFSLVGGDPVPVRMAQAARLTLLTPDRLPGRRYAGLRVSDQGKGIAREHLPRLTERFYRVEGQKSGERSGTGLGLAIVKHIVNRHRGGLAVESAVSTGSAFAVWIPSVQWVELPTKSSKSAADVIKMS